MPVLYQWFYFQPYFRTLEFSSPVDLGSSLSTIKSNQLHFSGPTSIQILIQVIHELCITNVPAINVCL